MIDFGSDGPTIYYDVLIRDGFVFKININRYQLRTTDDLILLSTFLQWFNLLSYNKFLNYKESD